jgi:hypothetical protein
MMLHERPTGHFRIKPRYLGVVVLEPKCLKSACLMSTIRNGSPEVLQNMINAVLKRSKQAPLAIAYTMFQRDFKAGGAVPFMKQGFDMSAFMFGRGFLPQMGGDLGQSYFEPPRPDGRRDCPDPKYGKLEFDFFCHLLLYIDRAQTL